MLAVSRSSLLYLDTSEQSLPGRRSDSSGGQSMLWPQEDHSQHPHVVAGLGTVDFPTSCNTSAQKWISRGAALLHSFGYEEARVAFNEARRIDPSCGMAHWGVARTWYHPIWAAPIAG